MNEHLKEVIAHFDEFKRLAEVEGKTDKELERFAKLAKLITNQLLKWWWQCYSISDIVDKLV